MSACLKNVVQISGHKNHYTHEGFNLGGVEMYGNLRTKGVISLHLVEVCFYNILTLVTFLFQP